MNTQKKVVLITGASSGIGMETAKNYLQLGYTVYCCSRRVERMNELTAAGAHCLPLDITNEDSIRSCISSLLDAEHRIDILVNNAGYGTYGPMETTPMDEVRRQFEVNFFGLAALTQLVIPQMRAQHSGCIVNIASMGGRFTIPFGGWYHATKYAVESYSDSLRQELAPFGIPVIIIEPGIIRTEWGIIAADNTRKNAAAGGVYSDNLTRYADYLDSQYRAAKAKGSISPKQVADVITRATAKKRPRTRYAVGLTAKSYILTKALLSDRCFDFICRKSIGLK